MKKLTMFLFVIMLLSASVCAYAVSPDHNTVYYAEASSVKHLQYNKEYVVTADMAVDNDLRTAWNEGYMGNGVGEWIILTPYNKRVYTYSGFQIANGFQFHDYYKGDRWDANNRISSLSVYDDSDTYIGTFHIQDMRNGYQTVYFDYPVYSVSLKFVIEGVWKGSDFPDACISELRPF